MSFTLVLPLPPSTNAMYVNVPGKGRVKSRVYSRWWHPAIKEIWRQVRADRGIRGPVSLSICVPLKMRGDIDNRIKGLLDALVASGRIDDDKHVQSITILRGGASTGTIEVQARAV